MESVLDTRSGRGFSWDAQTRQGLEQGVSISRGGIDDRRIRRLSEVVQPVSRSLWLDVATWIIAVLIGVGVGFFFLKIFFPELLLRQ